MRRETVYFAYATNFHMICMSSDEYKDKFYKVLHMEEHSHLLDGTSEYFVDYLHAIPEDVLLERFRLIRRNFMISIELDDEKRAKMNHLINDAPEDIRGELALFMTQIINAYSKDHKSDLIESTPLSDKALKYLESIGFPGHRAVVYDEENSLDRR